MKNQGSKKPTPKDERLALLRRVNTHNPGQSDIEAFRKLMNETPEVWSKAGDMMMQARESYITSFNAPTIIKEATKLHIAEMEKELASEKDGALEKLLVDQVIFCWLRLSIMEQHYTNDLKGSHTLTLGIYWEKRLSAAHKRYQKACEYLARVRKLMRPARPKNRINLAVLNALTSADQQSYDAVGKILTGQVKS